MLETQLKGLLLLISGIGESSLVSAAFGCKRALKLRGPALHPPKKIASSFESEARPGLWRVNNAVMALRRFCSFTLFGSSFCVVERGRLRLRCEKRNRCLHRRVLPK
jgi:hypothetical protein